MYSKYLKGQNGDDDYNTLFGTFVTQTVKTMQKALTKAPDKAEVAK